MTLGCRLEFHANSADGTIEGFDRDVAVNLAEPLGTQITKSRQDQHGIVWVAVPEDRPTPKPPVNVLQKLADTSALPPPLSWLFVSSCFGQGDTGGVL